MTERTPVVMIAILAAVTLSGCGERGAASGAAGSPGIASEEPIDAVPLSLDDNPLTPAPAVVAAAPVKAAAPAPEGVLADTADTTSPASSPEAVVGPAKIVIAPRDPARPTERAVERPADRPAERPVTPATPDKPPERPVLTF